MSVFNQFNEQPRAFCFPDKATASEFKQRVSKCRLSKAPTMRKTLATKRIGASIVTQPKFADSFTVSLTCFAFSDYVEVASIAKTCGAIPSPEW